MAKYVLSRLADADLANIYRYTYLTFGKPQADTYFETLNSALELLADNPSLGRQTDLAVSGVFRHECQQHIIFYRKESWGTLIIRILHRSMDIAQNLAPH